MYFSVLNIFEHILFKEWEFWLLCLKSVKSCICYQMFFSSKFDVTIKSNKSTRSVSCNVMCIVLYCIVL